MDPENDTDDPTTSFKSALHPQSKPKFTREKLFQWIRYLHHGMNVLFMVGILVIAILTMSLSVLWHEWTDKMTAVIACIVSLLIPLLGIFAAHRNSAKLLLGHAILIIILPMLAVLLSSKTGTISSYSSRSPFLHTFLHLPRLELPVLLTDALIVYDILSPAAKAIPASPGHPSATALEEGRSG